MDRLAWLRLQPWLLRWNGCSVPSVSAQLCSSCAAHKFEECNSIDWILRGYGWFHLNFCSSSDENSSRPPSKDSILTFIGLSDPAEDDPQLKVKVGVLACESRPGDNVLPSTCLLIMFDGNGPFLIDPQKITGVSIWTTESCEECPRQNLVDKAKICSFCDNAPEHVTMNLMHVALNICSVDDSTNGAFDTGKGSALLRLFNCIRKIQEETKSSSIGHNPFHGEEPSTTISTDEDELLTNTQVQRKQFLNSLDFIYDSANGAVDVCSANRPWMAEILTQLTNCVRENNDKKSMLQQLHTGIQKALDTCQEKEAAHFEKMLKSKSMEQDAMEELEGLKHKKEQLMEASLWLEIMLL